MSNNQNDKSNQVSNEGQKASQPGATPAPGQQNQGDKAANKPAEQQK